MSFGLLFFIVDLKMHSVRVVSFIGGKMRTIAQETVPQIALRICFKEIGGKDSIYVILVKEEYMQLSTFLVCVEFLLVFC